VAHFIEKILRTGLFHLDILQVASLEQENIIMLSFRPRPGAGTSKVKRARELIKMTERFHILSSPKIHGNPLIFSDLSDLLTICLVT
jgi:hypothetical protein